MIGAVASALGLRPQFNQSEPTHTSQTLVEIFKACYVGGEISREEFEQTRRDLDD